MVLGDSWWEKIRFEQEVERRSINVSLPVDDVWAFSYFPEHNWVYDKLYLARTLGQYAVPADSEPINQDVIYKPITNLNGLSYGVSYTKPEPGAGFLAQQKFEGIHLSIDLVVTQGDVVEWFVVQGIPSKTPGVFSHWLFQGRIDCAALFVCVDFINQKLSTFTGVVNVEIIGTDIIEVHLRPSAEWSAWFTDEYISSVVELYYTGLWKPVERAINSGCVIPVFNDFEQRSRDLTDIYSVVNVENPYDNRSELIFIQNSHRINKQQSTAR